MDYIEQRKLLEIETKWIGDILRKGGYCLICGYSDNPLVIELHHVAGKRNSDITISVCPTCHRILSLDQSCWDSLWTRVDNNPMVKDALFLRGLSDILKVKSNQMLGEFSNG